VALQELTISQHRGVVVWCVSVPRSGRARAAINAVIPDASCAAAALAACSRAHMPKRTCTITREALQFRETSLGDMAAMGYPREVLDALPLFDAEIMAARLKRHNGSWKAAHSLNAETAVAHFAAIDAAREAADKARDAAREAVEQARDERRRRREGAIDQELIALGRAVATMVRSARTVTICRPDVWPPRFPPPGRSSTT
jgi:hypothetical protein